MKYIKIITKTIFYTAVGILLVAVALVMILRTPFIQTAIAQYYIPIFSQKLGYPIYIEKVNVRFFDSITLENVQVDDPYGVKMIKIESLDVDFKLGNLTDTTKLSLDHARLVHPNINLVIDKEGNLNIDEFIQRINKLTASPKPKVKNPPKGSPFMIDEAELVDGIFSYNDIREARMNQKGKFDHNHFVLHDLNGTIKNFIAVADTVALQTKGLRFFDQEADLQVHAFNTKFLISDTQMRFDDLLLKLNKSVLRNRVDMAFKSQKEFKYWNQLVQISANFDSSRIEAADLGHFVDYMKQFKETYHLNGHFDGTVNDFKLTKSDIYFGKQSRLKGDFGFKGLPEIAHTHMDFRLDNTVLTPEDLLQYIGKEPTAQIQKFGKTTYDGTFIGFVNNFNTKGVLTSDLGKAITDLSLKLAPNNANSAYSGFLALDNFHLGKFFENEKDLQDITMSGRVKGQGFSLKDASFSLDGKIKHIDVKGYNYNDIYVDGTLKQEQYKGRIAIKDTNLTFDLAGEVDLRNGRNYFDLNGKLAKANLKPLHFSDRDIRLQSRMSVKFTGTDIDKIVGNATLFDTYVSVDKRNVIIDTLYVKSVISDSNRIIRINSDIVDVEAKGKFLPSRASKDLVKLIDEYKMYFAGNASEREAYYLNKRIDTQGNYQLGYQLNFKDFDPIINLLYPDIHISPNTNVSGIFEIGNTYQFTSEGHSDTLILGKYKFYQSDFELITSKFANNAEVLASALITSAQQNLKILAPTEKLEIEASWDKDRIEFTSALQQQKNTNRANLNGSLRFTPGGLELQFKRSKIKLLDQDWNINPDNLVSLVGKELMAKDFSVLNAEQLISMNGILSEDSLKPFNLKAKNFKLETLAPLIQLDLKGLVNGEVELKDVYRNVVIDSKLTIDNLYLENFLVGNLRGEGRWDDAEQLLNVDYKLDRLDNEIVTVKGTYDPKKKTKSLDLIARLNQTNLQILEPFTKGIFSKFGGTASGSINIGGVPNNPLLAGQIEVKKGTAYLEYLKIPINFEDKIDFDQEGITAKKLRITDEEGNKATLTGGVYHGGFGIYSLQVDVKMKNFKMLNTTVQDNDLYYGTAYATGDLSLFGPFDNLSIVSKSLKTERGTQIYIPLGGSESLAGTQEDVEFLDLAIKKDSIKLAKTGQKLNTKGIKMNFNFEFTPAATCEIQFDKQTGDVIRANGSGKVNMNIDTKGDFKMVGDYVIERGDYTFTFQNLLNKNFQIQKGSKISWTGDPYEATVDIKTVYTRYISYLGGLIDTTGRSDLRTKPEFTRRYPADVYVNLKERLLAPQISFDIKFRDYPQISDFNSAVTAFDNKIKNDDQELNRQVTALIIAGQMISPNYNSFGQQNIINNLTELLSNQVSNWASQIDKNLNIDLSLNGGLNQDLLNNLQLRFSYNFNNRLRITRSGGLTNATNQTNAQSLIGDLALEWFITPDGSVRFKTYSRNVQSSILGSLTNYQTFINTGFSMLYTKSFNTLFSSKKKYFPNQVTTVDDVPVAGKDGLE